MTVLSNRRWADNLTDRAIDIVNARRLTASMFPMPLNSLLKMWKRPKTVEGNLGRSPEIMPTARTSMR